MFEDFRKQAQEASFPEENPEEEPPAKTSVRKDDRFLGMTPPQRFIVSLMLLLMVIILGLLFLLVTSKIVLPFLG